MQCAKPIQLLIGVILLSLLLGSGRPAPALAQDDEPADAVDVTTICDTGQDFADCDGPTSVVGQASSGNFAFMPALFPNPSVLLFDMTNILAGQPEVFVPESGQILGIFTDPLFPQPGEFRINLPIEPTGAFLDVDNDGEEEAGVQIYALTVGSNLFGSSHLQQLEQATGLESYIMNIVTGHITEGTFLVYAPDDAQDFPAAPGADGIWFTEDDPTVTLPAGYTMVTLPKEGGSTLDRSAQVAMNTIERAEQTSPDFSDQGILESYNSLIDTLIDRYAYTELRGLDWESIRAEYLPQVEQADAAEDYGTYYNVLKAIAASLNDTHVSASSKDVSVIEAAAASADAPTTATVGATAFAAWDETTEKLGDRILVLTVGENSPAADAGWVPGTEIIAIDGEPVADRVAAVTLPSGIGTEEVRLARQASELLYFADGQSVTFEYRLPDTTETMTATMVAGDYELGIQGVPAVTGSTPVVYREIDDYAVVRWSDFVEYVLPKLAVLEEALAREQSRASGGVILDLRGNGGGWVTLYETMASYFFTGDDPMPVHLFDSYFFDSAAGKHVQVFPVDYMISAPNPDFAYTGPVVVLVDQGCASACEYFSQHLQLLERATVIGQYPTSGAGGTIERVTMPKGITFQFTQGGTYFAGTDEPNLEAKGVVPDVRVPITVETEQAKLRGEDPVMDAAVAFLDQKADRLVDNTWRWTAALDPALNPTPVEGDADYLITFNADGTLSITADCNQVNGAYERSDGDTVSITLGTSTLAQCPEGSLSDDFLAYLSAASAIAFENQNLALVLSPPVGDAFALLFGPVEMEAPADDTAVDTEAAGTSALSQEALRNATYSGIYDEPVTLTDGLYEDGPLTVQYLDGSEMVTDLDGDGVEDAVAFLLERGGGTANILYMAAQLNQEGQPVDAGAVRLDEVRIKSAAVLDGQIQLEIITMGPGDGDCCPSHKATKAFAYQDGQLVEVPGEEQELVQVSADDLNGTSWTLIETNYDTPAPPDAEISMSFADGKIAGYGGCNDYHSRFILGKDNPFVMTTSPVVSTQRACPEPILDQETAFFSALDDVAQWGYEFGRLALYYPDEGSGEYGRLLFAPRPASAELMADDGEDALAGVLWANPWQWVSFTNPVDQFDVEVPESYLLAFDEDGTVNIVADCNNAGGTYSDEDGALTIELGPMTMAACPPESRSDQFVRYLGSAARYFFQEGMLYIDLFADGGTMALAPGDAEIMADDGEGAMAGTPAAANVLPVAALRNATYSAIYDQPVTLTDGVFEAEPFTVRYVDGEELYGDLDRDGIVDAVVFLIERGGGTAAFTYLGAQLNRDGQPVDAGAAMVEDRTQILSASIENDQIRLEITTRGPGDADCCPSYRTNRTYALQDGQLAQVAGEDQEPVRISAADLDGTTWTLLKINDDQPALADTEVTISFQDGQIGGSGGCNNYNGSFSLSDDNPFLITIGPLASTQMACPQPILDQETAYLSALERVSRWGYAYGQLALAFTDDQGNNVVLLFAPQPASRAGQDVTATPEPADETAGQTGDEVTLEQLLQLNSPPALSEQEPGIFVVALTGILPEDDPLSALQGYIEQTYEGDLRDGLLELLAKLTPEDFEASSYVAQVRAEAAAAPVTELTPEEQAERQFRAQRTLSLTGLAYFLNMNIHCIEDYQFERYEDAANTYNDLDFPQLTDMDFTEGQSTTCVGWPVEPVSIEVKNPVSSAVPTLILQGACDNCTPVFMGRRASRELDNGTLIIVPRQGHEVWRDANNCAGQIATAFVLDPNAELDLSCLDARRPQWALPGNAAAQTPEAAETEVPAFEDVIAATFVCPDGTSIDATFDNAAVTVTITLPDGTVTLPRVEAASGAKYSDGTTTFWNKGDEALVEVNGEIVYKQCVAQN